MTDICDTGLLLYFTCRECCGNIPGCIKENICICYKVTDILSPHCVVVTVRGHPWPFNRHQMIKARTGDVSILRQKVQSRFKIGHGMTWYWIHLQREWFLDNALWK